MSKEIFKEQKKFIKEVIVKLAPIKKYSDNCTIFFDQVADEVANLGGGYLMQRLRKNNMAFEEFLELIRETNRESNIKINVPSNVMIADAKKAYYRDKKRLGKDY